MSKFKAGDRVRVILNPYNMQAQVGNEYTLGEPTGYTGPTRGDLYHADNPGVALFDIEIEGVAPEVPLFRKGDKVLVEYEVIADETQRVPGADRHVKVTAPGCAAKDGVTRLASFLAAGSITRAPEPPYVPKPGDEFFGHDNHVLSPYKLIFMDGRTVLLEQETSQGRKRFMCQPGDYKMEKPRPA